MARPSKRPRTSPRPVAKPAKPAAKPAKPVAPVTALEPPPLAPTPPASPFPIVGIGASAGGLEALETFLRGLPEHTGMAYVVIQHLDPNHKGMLVELLQRATRMPVAEVTQNLRVEPDRVYVIPPNKDMTLLNGQLQLRPQASPRGLNLPVDVFFRSLALDQQDRSIGVILSGMGADGTLGLRAISEAAGATFVQSLDSAKFDGMPRSAIDAGLADVVARVEQLPARILAYRNHAGRIAAPHDGIDTERQRNALDKAYALLHAHTGNDFSLYKRTTILRRIERRMGLHQIDSIVTYVKFLRDNAHEVELLFKELLIGVTSFFRDPATWDHLRDHVMPALIAAHAAGGVLRAWVPGCSTGEEAYSLAIAFREAMETTKAVRNVRMQIFATDLDSDAIERARAAIYPGSIAADVSVEQLRRFFVQDDRGYRVGKDIREMVVFATQNVCADPPFTKLDVLSCRNLLIYLSAELQRKLIPLFHYSLNPGGVLVLGSSETVGSAPGMFTPLDSKVRVYRKVNDASATVALTFPASVFSPTLSDDSVDAARGKRAVNLQTLVDRLLLQRFSPLGLLCNDRGDLLYTSSRAGKYLEPAVGKANMNVFAMAREGLRYNLSTAFAAALRKPRGVTVRGIKVGTNGSSQHIDLTVQRLEDPRELRGMVLVVITEVAAPGPSRPAKRRAQDPANIAAFQDELRRANEEAQTMREEMQTSQEELKSTNEELQSTNEELQSSNEELTTSKEEMQSLNEELQTVNQELQAKVDELSRSNNDMKNLLNSTDIATLFLDDELRVRRFTTPTAKIIKLIPADIGRAITDIASDLDYPALVDDAREVLRTLMFKEQQVGTKSGRWFVVRIMPYRTVENRIDGVVITFSDATETRALEAALRDQVHQFRQAAESLSSLAWGCRADGSCDFLSRQWLDYTGVPETEQFGYGWLEQVHPDDRVRVRGEWRAAVKALRPFESEFRLRSKTGAFRWFQTRCVVIRDSRGVVQKWYGTSTDVDEFKRARS